ncbi:MAG: VWA domain-containing protein [Flavobacteriales bacterium]|nr:VWA domain-containing protein [Flavobacteriales bacterium]
MKVLKIYSARKISMVVIISEILIILGCFFTYWIMTKIYGEVIFERKILFIALLSTLLISAISLIYLLRKNRSIRRFTNERLIQVLIPELSQGKVIAKYIIFRLALLLLCIALINPKYGQDEIEAKHEGIELMLCLDVSNSMKSEDIKPSRIQKAKRSIKRLIDKLHGDKVGLIVFAGEAYVQTPMTTDYAAASMFLSNVGPGIVPKNRQGTAIGAAIELALNSFPKESESKRAIIVITDGENHEDDAIIAATEARDAGIVVHTIGMGSLEGAPIPIFKGKKRIGYQKNNSGETVVSKLDEGNLREIAAAGDGVFVRATERETGLDLLLDEIDNMEKTEYDSTVYADHKNAFFPFLFIGFLLLVIESFITERKSKWLDRFKLFQE